MPFHPTGEASRMYSKYDEAQFHLRLTHELHAKIKQRAKMNNRSINAEIVATMEESLSKPSPVRGYRDEEERLAYLISEQVKEIAVDILRKEKTRS
ncbi:Arc family DNA-binding protein [Salmonella enterica]|nr:Arc family DNA-binding protein [Salmonella enterica subsp. enterica serovar Newport]EJB8545645.1 Arc family DNA-binding protein [Salmonella enterica]EKA7812866.1 Arc family DNA-binding protein [Salmonella enterica]